MIQLEIADNGNIKPCPYTDKCPTYPIGCGGVSFWCGREFKEEKRRENG